MIQITDKQSQKYKKNIAGPCITSYPLRVVQELTIGERWVPAEYFQMGEGGLAVFLGQ